MTNRRYERTAANPREPITRRLPDELTCIGSVSTETAACIGTQSAGGKKGVFMARPISSRLASRQEKTKGQRQHRGLVTHTQVFQHAQATVHPVGRLAVGSV